MGRSGVREVPPDDLIVLVPSRRVRGLVIGGEGLKAILRERPEAAMTMLAVLAERIGRQ